MKLKEVILDLVRQGTNHTDDVLLKRKISLTNAISLIYCALTIPFFFMFLFVFKNTGALLTSFSICYLSYLAIPLINRNGFYNISRFWLIIGGGIWILSIGLFAEPVLYIDYFVYANVVSIFAIFLFSEKRKIFVVGMTPLIVLLAFPFVRDLSHDHRALLTNDIVRVLSFFSILSSLGGMSLQMAYESYVSETQQRKLIKTLKELNESQILIQQQNQQLIYSSRMAALGEMAGGIAHEINNPMTVILARLHLIDKEIAKGEAVDREIVRKHIQSIELFIDKIVKIIKGLRSFSRDGSQDPFVESLVRHVLDETLNLCMNRLENLSIDLEIKTENQNEILLCRPVQVSQILTNLINNAVDAVQTQAEKWIRLHVYREGSFVYFRIYDSGLGVPESFRSKIMQPFFTTKEPGRGTGLGLSLSLGLAQAHGGDLFLDSDFHPSCFVLKIPAPQKTAVNTL